MSDSKEKQSSKPERTNSFTREGSGYLSSERSDSLILESPEECEQNCLLFPTYATKHACNDEGTPILTDKWNIRIHGWAFSTPRSSKSRALFLKITSLMNNIQKTDSQYEHLQSRTPLFWASNLDNKEFFVEVVGMTKPNKMAIDGDPNDVNDAKDVNVEQFAEGFMETVTKVKEHHHGHTTMGDETYKIPVVSSSGNFSGGIAIQQPTMEKWLKENGSDGNMLKLEVYQNEGTRPAFGVVNLIEPKGVSVISDIDDTIKETAILSGPKTMFLNTFLHPFKDVPGMSALYRSWYDKGAVFHYVSNSPWQLFPTLRSFFDGHNFPPGSAHLRLYEFIKSPRDNKGSKKGRITELLKDFPERKFILVGDTGERDPEIYAEIAKEFKGQIIRILVRDVNTPHLNSQPGVQRTRSYSKAIKYFKKVYSGYGEGKEQGKETEMATESSEVSSSSNFCRSLLLGDRNTRSSSNNQNFRQIVSSTISSIKNAARTPIDETENSSDPGTPMEMESEDPSSVDSDEDTPMSPNVSKIEMFNKRIRDLQGEFDEGFFSTFHDPDELKDDPIIKIYLHQKY